MSYSEAFNPEAVKQAADRGHSVVPGRRKCKAINRGMGNSPNFAILFA